MVAGNRPSSLGLPPGQPLDHRHGGRLSSTTGELSIHGMGDDYTVEGNGTIKSLPTMPVGTTAYLRILGTPTFTNSSKLVCENSADYVASAGDYVTARSDGDGVWRLYVESSTRVKSINGQTGALAFIVPPQGRLTLTTGVPETTADVTGATSLFYTPGMGGNQIPIYDGTNMVPTAFAELTQAISDTTKSPYSMPANGNVDVFVWNDSGTTRATRSDYWTNNATATMTIASPAVVSFTAHGGVAGTPVRFTTSGALPTGVTAGTVYYIIAAGLTANAFEFAATVGGAAINTSGSQSGTHTAFVGSDTGRGTGAGTPELQLVNGIWTNKNAITNGPAANKGTLVGSVRGDSVAQLRDTKAFRWVSNAYNSVLREMSVVESTASWNYTTSTFRQANANTANQLDFLQTLAGGQLNADVLATYSNTSTSAYGPVGIDIDTINTTTIVNNRNSLNYVQLANALATQTARYNGCPGMGRHIAIWKEFSAAAGTGTFYGTAGGTIMQSGISGSILN